MGKNSGIQWTDHTFNIVHGCMRVSEACDSCYAEASYVVMVYQAQKGVRLWGPESKSTRRILSDDYWRQPHAWNRAAEKAGVRARVFCSSLADVFESNAIVETQRQRLWPVIEATPWLDWQLLTKRPENIHGMLPAAWRDKMPENVWLGTTVENQARAEERIPHLLKHVTATVLFLSMEPLCGPVDLLPTGAIGETCPYPHNDPEGCVDCMNTGIIGPPSIQWVIVGGESKQGAKEARPFDLGWARSIIRQCAAGAVPVFMKQLGSRPAMSEKTWRAANLTRVITPDAEIKAAGKVRLALTDSHGGDPAEWPAGLNVREFPRGVGES